MRLVWRPAKQVTRPLPCSFEKAEEQALKLAPEKIGNGESVSIYFTAENAHQAFLNVRQTDDWDELKNDPIFAEIPAEKELITIEECIAMTDRPDVPVESEPPADEEMRDAGWNVMENLEQALTSGQEEDTRASASTAPPAQVPNTSRSQSQEDILAQLGVTGSPKPVTHEPISIPMSAFDDTSGPAEKPARYVTMDNTNRNQLIVSIGHRSTFLLKGHIHTAATAIPNTSHRSVRMDRCRQ